jgi:Fe-S-cluster containining protein
MSDPERKRTGNLPAGEFARWLHGYLRAQTEVEPANDVPCGDCNACCRASYIVPIQSDERETLARIPPAWLTRSARDGLPQWALVQACAGNCPMLVDNACSIYAQRPQTCRRFDCRVFAATGVGLGSGPRARLNARVWQWRFEYPSELDAECQNAVLAAAAFLRRRGDLIESDVAPTDAGELAKAAVFVHEIFLDSQLSARADAEIAEAINQELRRRSDAQAARTRSVRTAKLECRGGVSPSPRETPSRRPRG